LTHLYNLIGTSSDRDFTELLFGPGLEKGQRTAAERRLAILGAIISAANLESHFRPKLLSPHQLQAVLDELCESLIRL